MVILLQLLPTLDDTSLYRVIGAYFLGIFSIVGLVEDRFTGIALPYHSTGISIRFWF